MSFASMTIGSWQMQFQVRGLIAICQNEFIIFGDALAAPRI